MKDGEVVGFKETTKFTSAKVQICNKYGSLVFKKEKLVGKFSIACNGKFLGTMIFNVVPKLLIQAVSGREKLFVRVNK